MNDTRSLRRDLTKSVDVGHDIVPPPLLLNAGNLKVRVRNNEVVAHLLERLFRDGLNPKLFLLLSQVQP